MKKIFGFGMILAAGLPLAACTNKQDTLNIIWYPGEGTTEREPFRNAMKDVLEDATGRTFQNQVVTDYESAVEAIASGGQNAVIPAMSPNGYILAHDINDAVIPLANAALDGDIDKSGYYSWIIAMTEEHGTDTQIKESHFGTDGEYELENIRDTNFSFVSGTSTSGFKYPASTIAELFGENNEDKDNIKSSLAEGEDAGIFSNVEFGFGNTHQGSLYNLLEGTSDVAAVCDGCIRDFIQLTGDIPHNTPGATYRVTGEYAYTEDEDGTPVELFKQHKDKEFVVLSSTQVPGVPFVINEDVFTKAEIEAIKEMLISDIVTDNPLIFNQTDGASTGFYHVNEKFTLDITDGHYDALRAL